MKPRWNELLAIFLAAGATLLFEVTITKVFEFKLWANYAYLVISTAMFGLGLSGVILTRWPRLLRIPAPAFLSICSFACAATIMTAFTVVNELPLHLPTKPDNYVWYMELRNLNDIFLALGLPFVFFGLIISYLFEHRSKHANVYYFADLVGAGLGSFAIVLLIRDLEPQGLTVLCAFVTAAAGALFLLSATTHKALWRTTSAVILAAAVAGSILLAPQAADKIPLKIHIVKRRGFDKDFRKGRIEATEWSVLSRVDIAPLKNTVKRVWISGGVNESSIVSWRLSHPDSKKGDDPRPMDYEALRAQRTNTLARAVTILDYKALPHLSKIDHTVAMIGTSGGEDSVYALQLGARKVTGIEMDPMIVRLVTKDYRDFAGGLFTDNDYSEIVVDEARSYMRRSDKTFDVIQMVNNFTPIAFQNGALNLSETYLLTVESFGEFYDHLSDDGILAMSRYGSIRMLTTAVEMFRRRGLTPEEYSKHLFVCEGPQHYINTFMMKKSPFTEEEINTLFDFFKTGRENGYHNRSVLYAPYRTNELPSIENNLYYKVATADDPQPFWNLGCFTFAPPTDNKPFFNRLKVLGRKERSIHAIPMLPSEIFHVEKGIKNKIDRRVPPGDIPVLVVLLEAMLLSSVFFGIPLLSKKELRKAIAPHKKALGYFACLGVAFIFVEICLIQKLVLFLGAPVYSIATVLCSLLVSAGLGSLVSGRMKATHRTIRILMIVLPLIVILLNVSLSWITDAFLGYSLTVRIIVALCITGVAGFLMGMPMPTGIRHLKDTGRAIIPWAWATNGYFTVVGSALSVLVASTTGFTSVFVIAAALYAISPWFLSRG